MFQRHFFDGSATDILAILAVSQTVQILKCILGAVCVSKLCGDLAIAANRVHYGFVLNMRRLAQLADLMTQSVEVTFACGDAETRRCVMVFGNKLVFRMPDKSLMLVLKETQLTPKTRIESTFEPHWAGPDVPLEASRFVYLIEPQGEFCLLTLEHYDIPAGQEGVADGWHRTLAGLKTWLETGKTIRYAYPEEA